MTDDKEFGPLLQKDTPPDIKDLLRQVRGVERKARQKSGWDKLEHDLAQDTSDSGLQFTSEEEKRGYQEGLRDKMGKLLELKTDPIGDEDQDYFKRVNKFTSALGLTQQVLLYFSESLINEELRKQILERIDDLRQRIAKKKRVVIDESEINPETKRVERRYRVREGIPISDDEVQEMKQFLRIGLMVLEEPLDLDSKVKSAFEQILRGSDE